MSTMLNYLRPQKTVRNIMALDPALLYQQGVRVVGFDFDQTLSKQYGREIAPELKEVIAKFAKVFGHKLCVISNQGKSQRIQEALRHSPLTLVTGHKKPRTSAFVLAEKLFKEKPEHCLYIGDRILTDILGANFAGWRTTKVSPLVPKSDPLHLVLTRKFENLLVKFA